MGSGDRVENVLYRIEKTQIPENVSHIYIAVGTNNLFKDKEEGDNIQSNRMCRHSHRQ